MGVFMNRSFKVREIKYICLSGGVLGPKAICGKVSIFQDKQGHRCCAHGNTTCIHKSKIGNIKK